jgi:uncharacterized protein
MMPAVPSPRDTEVPTSSATRGGTDHPTAGFGPAETGPPPQLRPPRHQVDRRAIGLWSVHAALTALAVVVVLAGTAALAEPARTWLLVAAGIAAVAGIGYVIAMPRIRYRVHRWEVTDEAVYTKSGWITHEWRVAPLSRVQTVDARRGPLQQALGLSSVRITTASAAGDVVIDGLDHLLAADLVDRLTERTQATPGDAT